ncbi:hypothetical protein HC248_01073 [Polaromonas vacuolata]|uniref:Lipoprotein n=1 Tax=Polaromonas vacuolata TaxID=37448 RepID=A0A6H2H7I1_9BURK|nr:hypothetical protein [Polaromonas vacuolata]QJC55790.1 hypothetical protein HC248_01073 [Polaromonas vacuolata]
MRLNKISLAAMVIGSGLLLAACGGGGSGGSTANLSISGTAAVGVAIEGTAVATCKSGTGTAVSNATTGNYTVNVAGGVGPCLLKLTPTNPDRVLFPVLYSVSSGVGASQTSNITPLTSLLVTYLSSVPGITAASPEAWFSSPSTVALLSNPTALNLRITRDFIPAIKILVPSLNLAGSEFLGTAFVTNPNSSTTDKDLESLKLAITNNTITLSGLINNLKSNAAATPAVTAATGAAS